MTDELTAIYTVADLKDKIAKLPDDMKVYLYTNDNTFFLEACICEQKCQAHNGKFYTSEGLIFEVIKGE